MAIPMTAQRAPSFSARTRRRRRAAVKGSIAWDELTRIDLDEMVELQVSGVDEKDLTYLSFAGSNFGGGDAPHRPDRTLHPSVGVCEAESLRDLSPEFLPQVLAAEGEYYLLYP